MIEVLYHLDKEAFIFCNQTLANPVFDVVMPFLTDLNQHWYGLAIYALAWLLLMWKGGRRGRIIGWLLIPLIVLSDQLSSTVIKNIIQRPRPCHEIVGVQVVERVRLLVPCGSGYSFPSSHAVNNFAVATFLACYFARWRWFFFSWAAVIAFTRPYIGVHFPSDAIGGAIIGALCAIFISSLWNALGRRYPVLSIPPQQATIAQGSVESGI